MSFKAMRSAALAATFLAGSAMMAHAQTSSTIGTGGSTAGVRVGRHGAGHRRLFGRRLRRRVGIDPRCRRRDRRRRPDRRRDRHRRLGGRWRGCRFGLHAWVSALQALAVAGRARCSAPAAPRRAAAGWAAARPRPWASAARPPAAVARMPSSGPVVRRPDTARARAPALPLPWASAPPRPVAAGAMRLSQPVARSPARARA